MTLQDPMGFQSDLDAFREKLFPYVLARIDSAGDADDLCRRVLNTLSEKRATLPEGGDFEQWAYSVAQGAVLESLREKFMRDDSGSSAGEDAERDTPLNFWHLDSVITLLAAVEENKSHLATACLCLCFHWLHDEVAVYHGMDTASVSARVSGVRKKLRDFKADAGQPAPDTETIVWVKTFMVDRLLLSGLWPMYGTGHRNSIRLSQGYQLAREIEGQYPDHPTVLWFRMGTAYLGASLLQYASDEEPTFEPHEMKRNLWDRALIKEGNRYYQRLLDTDNYPNGQKLRIHYMHNYYTPASNEVVDWTVLLDISREIVGNEPESEYHYEVSQCLRYLESPAAAAKYLESFMRLPNYKNNARVQRKLAGYYYDDKQWRNAAHWYQRVLRNPANPALHQWLQTRLAQCENNT